MERKIDIASNANMIEMLKALLLTDAAGLLADSLKRDGKNMVVERLSNIVLTSYLLGRRLGIDYETVDERISEKISLGIIGEDKLEVNYGDLSALKTRILSKRGSFERGQKKQ